MSSNQSEKIQHVFPIKCGRLFRVGENRLEPNAEMGYLYLGKNEDSELWILSWEIMDSSKDSDNKSNRMFWSLKVGEFKFNCIDDKRTIYLVINNLPEAFFWFNQNEFKQISSALIKYNEMFKKPMLHFEKDRWSIPKNETEEERKLREADNIRLSAMVASNQSTSVQRNPPKASSLDKLIKPDVNFSLSDVLKAKTLSSLFLEPGVVESLLPFIPEHLRSKGVEGINEVLNSSNFVDLVTRLQLCLELGGMSAYTVSSNLGYDAGKGVLHLLAAIQNKIDKEWEEELNQE